MRRLFIIAGAILIVLSMVLASMGSVLAAPLENNPGKKQANFDRIAFVHYPKGEMAKGGIPGGPADKDYLSDKEWYKYSGVHWEDSAVPVIYKVESTTVIGDFLEGIEASFQTWEDDSNSYIDFERDSSGFTGLPSSFIGTGSRNGDNEVGWVSLGASYPKAIAVTVIWYNRLTGIIVEVDMAMNADLPWYQADLPAGTVPDTAIGDKDFYDVQNIATHEVGHWLMLGDLYSRPAGEETMYGIGAKGELKKRSLGPGDLAGLISIYGGSSLP